MTEVDYYKVLGVPRKATESEIRRAYKTASKEWHPDKNLGNQTEATRKFTEISEAFSVLFDEKKRRAYDKRCAEKSGCTQARGSEFRKKTFRETNKSSDVARKKFEEFEKNFKEADEMFKKAERRFKEMSTEFGQFSYSRPKSSISITENSKFGRTSSVTSTVFRTVITSHKLIHKVDCNGNVTICEFENGVPKYKTVIKLN